MIFKANIKKEHIWGQMAKSLKCRTECFSLPVWELFPPMPYGEQSLILLVSLGLLWPRKEVGCQLQILQWAHVFTAQWFPCAAEMLDICCQPEKKPKTLGMRVWNALSESMNQNCHNPNLQHMRCLDQQGCPGLCNYNMLQSISLYCVTRDEWMYVRQNASRGFPVLLGGGLSRQNS